MLSLKDIRDCVASLGVAGDDHVYIGKLDSKKQKSIGIYSRRSSGTPITSIGGQQNSSYGVKPVSILVHWNTRVLEAEQAANDLFEKLRGKARIQLGDTKVQFIRMMVPEPQDVGTDDQGVYEYVIWLDFIYEKG